MIVVRLAGGLGNQMFQYAAGRGLAVARGTELKLDTSFYSTQTLRSYTLDKLNVQQLMATEEEVNRLTGGNLALPRRWLFRLWQQLAPVNRRSIFVERDPLHFDRRVFDIAADVYLIGYWQNRWYFSDVAESLRTEFQLRSELSPCSCKVARMIENAVAVGVHVRRGDYVSNSETQRLHGVCSREYYDHCARAVMDLVPAAHFFVFSDDPEWTAANLQLPGPMTVVKHNGSGQDYEDLHLLSRCRHFILANSTFGWWAVWLATPVERLVYAPKRWFATDMFDTIDFVPGEWRLI
jgi:hypothetical protein